ncbi:NB-ARC domain-containing protein [Actinoplanes sp. NPDC051475]|uniref:NB-ARC domain-containing protein n=1 Tax=Actinoplanes sp. NPDC051475 TaxID=3157225 RepID=UPI00344BE672
MAWPVLIGRVPPLADHRQDRPADRDLRAAARTVVVCQVLSGLGGVGKTQLAAGLAHRLWRLRAVDLLIWVSASSRTGILTSYGEAAAAVTGAADIDPEVAAVRLLAWLGTTNRRWLVVLDDVVEPQDLAGLWPPDGPHGRTVVTTRRRDAGLVGGRQLIDVDVFTPEEALLYLRKKLSKHPDRLDQAAALAADLSYLPLALAQASAYLIDQGLTCADYRRRLADQRRRLADLAPHALPDEHRATVAATWSLSIGQADRLAPRSVGRPVLELASLLHPNSIPTGLFTTAAMVRYCTSRLGSSVDADDLHDAVWLLHRFNLATIDPATSTVRVHALVQRAVREATEPGRTHDLVITAADALLAIWPDSERDPATNEVLRANADALCANAEFPLWNRHGCHAVLRRAGESLEHSGIVGATLTYWQQMHATGARLLNQTDPTLLFFRYKVAHARGEAGEHLAAAVAMEHVLSDQVKVLGRDDPAVLLSRGGIAWWRRMAGDTAGAVAAFETLFAERTRVLGPDHYLTLSARTNLVAWHADPDDPASAVAEFSRLLTDLTRVLGPRHPTTLGARGDLLRWKGMRNVEAAKTLVEMRKLLQETVETLGPSHQVSLATHCDLADLTGKVLGPESAVAVYDDVLAHQIPALGPDHPKTLAARGARADWWGKAGHAVRAAEGLRDVMADQIRVLSAEHPDTVATSRALDLWQRVAGLR